MLWLLNEALRLGTQADPLCWRILLARAEVSLSLDHHESAVVDLHNVLSSPQHDIPELLTDSLKLLARVSLDRLSLGRQSTLLAVYSKALDLLFVSIGFALDRSSQLQRVASATDAGARAFTISRRVNDLPAGLAVLERARGVIWSQALQFRDPQLDGVPPDLQKRLRTIFRATSSAQSGEWDSEDVESSLESEIFLSTQDVMHQRHTQLQQVISDIRGCPGLGDFMRGPDVLTTTTKSTVVVLVADEIECHAIVIRSPHDMDAIRLDLGAHALQELTLAASASSVRGTLTFPTEDNRLGLRAIPKQRSPFYATLAKVWRIIVKPVIPYLQLKGDGQARPRIHWCPTGVFAFVPVHAAGIYHGENQECCSDYFVSSYTPTLNALARAEKNSRVYTTRTMQVTTIAVERAHDASLPCLRHVIQEARQIVDIAENAGAAANFVAEDTSKDAIIASLESANVVHLACHGIQHSTEPHESHFCLGSGDLTVSDLIEVDLKDAFLAFLSACETAKGDRKHADEVVHLAATMLFAGFQSVVATMWAMHDQDGPFITKRFYAKLFTGETVDVDTVAYALDYAVSKLRASGVPPERWATFVHMGA